MGDGICAFESALISSRMFIEFLGFGVKYKYKLPYLVQQRLYHSLDELTTDEVKIIDLGGRFATLDQLSQEEQSLLALLCHTVHKSTAHLTYNAPFVGDMNLLDKCIPIVDRLLKQNLFDPLAWTPTLIR